MPLEIDEHIVKKYLTTLNEFRSPGPDELHPRILKELAKKTLRTAVHYILKIIGMGEIPDD